MDQAAAKLNGLTVSDAAGPRLGPGGKPVVNTAVVGEWVDAKKSYKGPKLSNRTWDNQHDAKAEGLDYVFRISECGQRASLPYTCLAPPRGEVEVRPRKWGKVTHGR